MPYEVFVTIRDLLPRQAQRDYLELAYWYGIRAGQLRRTLLSNVSTERWALVYQPDQVKNRKPHVIPLEGRGLEIVQRLWATRRLDCPYLFHSHDCLRRPEGKPCLGSFKKAWATACKKAGLPVGRKHGGYVFHNTRHTAVTNMVHSGMPESLAMSVSGHRTRAVFDRYSIRREDAVREALEQRTAYVTERAGESKVVPLRGAK
jgi:integrase